MTQKFLAGQNEKTNRWFGSNILRQFIPLSNASWEERVLAAINTRRKFSECDKSLESVELRNLQTDRLSEAHGIAERPRRPL